MELGSVPIVGPECWRLRLCHLRLGKIYLVLFLGGKTPDHPRSRLVVQDDIGDVGDFFH
jgi:hypothetical protein